MVLGCDKFKKESYFNCCLLYWISRYL